MAVEFIKRTTTFTSTGYLNDAKPSSDGKWIAPAAWQSATQKLLVRDDATGNYPTTITPAGSPAFYGSSVEWKNDDSEFYVGSSGGTVEVFKQTAGAWSWAFSHAVGGGNDVRGLSYCAAADHLATMDLGNGVRFWKRTGPTTFALLATFAVGTFSEDIQYSPDGNYAVAVDRGGTNHFFKRVGDVYTKLGTQAAGNWHISWHPDSTHVASILNSAAKPYIFKRTGDAFTLLANPYVGGAAVAGIGADYVSGGKYLVHMPSSTAAPQVYLVEGDVYTGETQTGLVGETAYDARSSRDGSTFAAGGGGGTVSVYSTPPPDEEVTVLAALELPGLTVAAVLNQPAETNTEIVLSGLTTDGLLGIPFGGAAEIVLSGLESAALMVVGEDVVPGLPWQSRPTWVQVEPGDLIWASRTPLTAFVYGDIVLPGLTTAVFATLPLEANVEAVLPGLTTGGLLKFPITAEMPEGVLPSLSAAGSMLLADGDVGGAFILPGLTAEGEIDVPFGVLGDLSLYGLSAEGEIDVPFGMLADLSLPGLSSKATVKVKYQVDVAAALPGLQFFGTGPEPFYGVAEVDLPGLTAEGEVFLPEGVFGALTLPGLGLTGLVYQTVIGEGELVLPGLTAAGVVDRFYQIDANLRLPGLTASILVGYPVKAPDVALVLPGLSVAGYLDLPLVVDLAAVLPGLTTAAYVEGAARNAAGPNFDYGFGYTLTIGNGLRFIYGENEIYTIG